jgi:glutaredoxin-like protein NrdH
MSNESVLIYVKPQCVQCDQTKRILDREGIEYSTIDITQDAAALEKVLALGFKSAPVVVTEEESWAGFNPAKINSLVERSKQ